MVRKFAVIFLMLLSIITLFAGCIQEKTAVEKSVEESGVTNDINKDNNIDIIETLKIADNVILSQGYEPDLQLILKEEELDILANKSDTLKPMRAPDVHGSGYPAYEITFYKDGNVLLIVKIEDPATVLALSNNDSYYEYFKQDGGLWTMAREWLPLKETRTGTIEHLYKANKVEVNLLDGGCTLIEYNLEKQPAFSFRVTALVSVLKSAKIKEKIEPIDDGAHYMTIYFNVENQTEKVEIYENYAIYEDVLLEMNDIAETISYIVQDGPGTG